MLVFMASRAKSHQVNFIRCLNGYASVMPRYNANVTMEYNMPIISLGDSHKRMSMDGVLKRKLI
ncbi:hypothetical protein D3C76_1573690 [compost metagenome]